MATTTSDNVHLTERLLERLETETDPAKKAEVMRRLELSRFMYSLVEDREQFLEQVVSKARTAFEKEPTGLYHEGLLQELRVCLRFSKQCTSKPAMAKIQQEASRVIGQIIASMWAADAELKCQG